MVINCQVQCKKMDLPDCPPGAEGYEDTVVEVPKKPDQSQDHTITKAEQEFQEHLRSLKIKVEDGSIRFMVERRGRDVSGKWIYLCYPCAAKCSGETILQTHISGKKHKNKLAMKSVWPVSIFQNHPYNQSENSNSSTATPTVLKKMAEEVEIFNKTASELEDKYKEFKNVRCHIQDVLDNVKAPLIGLEYLVEHPPLESHYEPSYICALCSKQGYPRTIINHLTCYWHRFNYLQRHFPKATSLLKPYGSQTKYREGVTVVLNRLAQRIVEKYGLMEPVNIDKEEYERNKESIHKWLFQRKHFSETKDCTFEEVVDIDLIDTLNKSNDGNSMNKDPSPPVVAAPKPQSNRGAKRERQISVESLSDLSDELERITQKDPRDRAQKPRLEINQKARFESYSKEREISSNLRTKYPTKLAPSKSMDPKGSRPPNYEYKVKLAQEKVQSFEDTAKKMLAYHEKNPEKHPLYPEEWKKFWNRRYKEIQAEGKDPSKHDFKPEWIVYWTGRMKELHKEELRIQVMELYRRLCLTPPDAHKVSPPPVKSRHKSPSEERRSERRRSPFDVRRRSPDPRRRSPDSRRRSPDPRRRSPDPRRRSPDLRRRSPELRRRSPVPRRRTPDLRRRSPPPFRRDHRSPPPSYHHDRRRSPPPRRHSPVKMMRGRSRSPIHSMRSPARTNIMLESRGSRSPLSRRETAHRNRSPVPHKHVPDSLNTVLISDDELKPDDGLSPWNSDNDIDSLGSLPDARSPAELSRTGSVARSVHSRPDAKLDMRDQSPENIVATLRILVALEDYLGSLGPKIIDLLAEAISMEKAKANSSEELLEREAAVMLVETAKEKLKGAAQAGLVAPAAAAAVRAAVVRAAATLHEADKRSRHKMQPPAPACVSVAAAGGAAPGLAKKRRRCRNGSRFRKKRLRGGTEGQGQAVPVAGVGAVDREQIARQMAAALVAQGKTDVSSEELAQLVDAVVGMAEAKKREADEKKQAAAKSLPSKPASESARGTASALQMLQSAYDDKKVEKEDAPDAMDGLSDSDLETLLKNFNELSAEEQHSLIAYLKKLEAREPQRVERLRQYVSAAATNAPVNTAPPPAAAPAPAPAAPDPAPAQPPAPAPSAAQSDLLPVTIESDDDDYTVEEVFKSVTEKVKENQIRQEMEIVKKSLEESKVTAAQIVTPAASAPTPNTNLLKNMSSAADLLALVQASLQSVQAQMPAAIPQIAEVVSTNTHPRSFGDISETSNVVSQMSTQSQQPAFTQQGLLRVPQKFGFGSNNSTLQNDPQLYKQPIWESKPLNEPVEPTGPLPDQGYDNVSQDNSYSQGRGPQDNSYNQNRGPQNNPYAQGRPQDNSYTQNRGPLNNLFGQGRGSQDNSYNQVRGAQQDNSYNLGRGPQQDNSYNPGRGPQQDNSYNPGRGPQQDNSYNQGRGLLDNSYNKGRGPQDNSYNQGRGPQDNSYNQSGGPQTSQDNFYNQGSRGPNDNSYNQMGRGLQGSFNQGGRGSHDNSYNQGGRGSQDEYNQNQMGRRQDNTYSQGGMGPQDNSYNQGGAGQDMYNQRTQGGNFGAMNIDRLQGIRPQNQNNQINRRGRGGRGNPPNRARGRGRGGFN